MPECMAEFDAFHGYILIKIYKNSSGDEIANVNFFTTSHM